MVAIILHAVTSSVYEPEALKMKCLFH